jgi:protein O-GlcNAc transferase
MMFLPETDTVFPLKPLTGFPRVGLNSDITIGMSAHGNHVTTLSALNALFLSIEGEYELILVDDCSPDQTLDLFCKAADYHSNTKIFSFDFNQEYSGSLNAILSHATGRFIIFLSNDILVTPTYISTLLEVAQHSEEFGIVRGTSNFVDNGIPSHNIVPSDELSSIEELFIFSRGIYQQLGDELGFDRFLTGDAFLVSRQVLDAIGSLDPLFYGYFADHDFGVRACRAGFRLVLARGAYAMHKHTSNFDYLSEVERTSKRERRWARVNENWARFKMKYALPVERHYDGIRRIEWEEIAESSVLNDRLYVPPKDYTSDILAKYDGNQCVADGTTLSHRARKLMFAARLADAAELCKWGINHSDSKSNIMSTLGGVRLYQGDVEEAIKCFASALHDDPFNLKAHSNLLLAMNYSEQCTQQEIYYESRRWETIHCLSEADFPCITREKQNGCIRLGIISGDMKRHSISYFLEPFIEGLDRSRFEIYCYSDVTSPDDVSERLNKLADIWLNSADLKDDELAGAIRSDQVDILIDLAGHTGTMIRLPVFCRKPAPIQISWLGYPNTTGLSVINYRLTDEFADPHGLNDCLYTEKLIRLKNGFLCYRPPDEAPEVGLSPCRQNGYITFGSFNMLPKISPGVLALWARLLRRVKNSRLLLKCHYFADHATAERFLGYFADFGITRDRIELRSAVPDTQGHLAIYNEIDIALDTFPYNGTTTTFEALWMGVPVVTLVGDRHSARVGGSILTRLGLSELVATSSGEYINLTEGLAKDLKRLVKLRSSLRLTLANSSLCDAVTFCKEIGSVFEKMTLTDQSQ